MKKIADLAYWLILSGLALFVVSLLFGDVKDLVIL